MPVEVEKVGQRASSFVPALPLDYNWGKRQHRCAHRRAGSDIDCGVNGVVDRAIVYSARFTGSQNTLTIYLLSLVLRPKDAGDQGLGPKDQGPSLTPDRQIRRCLVMFYYEVIFKYEKQFGQPDLRS